MNIPTPTPLTGTVPNWRVDATYYVNRGVLIVDEKGEEIADVAVIDTDYEAALEANEVDESVDEVTPLDFAHKRAQVMSVAPKLLAALKALVEVDLFDPRNMDAARQAIAEAEKLS